MTLDRPTVTTPETVSSWLAAVADAYPPADAADWDEVGLHVGDPADPVSGVLVTLDVTEQVLDEAVESGADLVVAHHPLLFRPLGRLTPATAAGRLALAAARRGIAVVAAHTNVDAAVDGTSEPMSRLLGLVDARPLRPLGHSDTTSADGTVLTGTDAAGDEDAAPPDGPRPTAQDGTPQLATAQHGKGLGRVGDLPQPRPLGELARVLAEGLPSPDLRLGGDPQRHVGRVAVCGGAGDSLIDAAVEAGADLYVTGDLRHHPALDARTRGLAVIDAGHYWTEAAALPAVRARLAAGAARHGLRARLIASTVTTHPWTPADRWRRA